MVHPGILSRAGKLVVGICLLFSVSGCSKRWVREAKQTPYFQEQKEHVVVRVAQLDADDCKRRFGKNLLSYGYQPLVLTIYNDSDDAFLLRASSIDLPLESAYDVAQISRIPIVAYTAAPAYAAGLFFWPALIPVIGAGMYMASCNRTVAAKLHAYA